MAVVPDRDGAQRSAGVGNAVRSLVHEDAGGRIGSEPGVLRIADHVPDALLRWPHHVACLDRDGVAASNNARRGSRHIIQAIRPDVAVRLSSAAEVERVELARRKRPVGRGRPNKSASSDEPETSALVLRPR